VHPLIKKTLYTTAIALGAGPAPVDPCATPDSEWVGTYAQA
jgi:hypothetical protein